MFGGHWTREQKTAYRTAFSLERIGDEVWLVVGLAWFVVFSLLVTALNGIVAIAAFLVGFFALYGLTWRFILPWLERTMPEELREALPRGRFEGPSSPTSPRTYRELVRRWLIAKARAK